MTFSIGMRTIGGRKVDYLSKTLARLVETGTLQHPLVRGLHISHGEGLSPNQNGCRALKMAASDGSDWVLFLEDDVDFINDFMPSTIRWLAKFVKHDIRVYPLCCFYSTAVNASKRVGAWQMPVEKYYGSQGFLIRTPDAVDYANWLTGLNKPREEDVSFDIHLARWHKMRVPGQETILTPAPCFMDHTGEFSLMGDPKSWGRVGPVEGFAGRNWSYSG